MDQLNESFKHARMHVHNHLQFDEDTVRRLHTRVVQSISQPAKKSQPAKWLTASAAALVFTLAATQVEYISKMWERSLTNGTQSDGRLGLEKMNDQAKTYLIDKLPLGSTYQTVKQKLPQISELQPQAGFADLADRGLTQAFVMTTVFNRETKLVFNFKNDQLYALNFNIENLDAQTSADLEKQVIVWFTGKYGPSDQQKPDWKGVPSLVPPSWTINGIQAGVNYTHNTLTWGYQVAN